MTRAGRAAPLSPVAAVGRCLRGYARFQGRAPLSEFWWFMLFVGIASVVAAALDRFVLGLPDGRPGPAAIVFALALIVPSLAVTARRLHDTARGAWWLALLLVPIAGWLILVYFCLQPGDHDGNAFGPDPLQKAGPGRRRG